MWKQMQGLSLFVLLAVLAEVWSLRNLCPAEENLHPCGCVSDGKDIRVDCIMVRDVEEVRRALQSVRGMRRVFVDFLRARFDRVPSDLFQGLHVTQLSFTNCELRSFGDEGRSALEGLEDVIEDFGIHFSFPDGNELRFLNVSGLRSLEDFWLEGNDMSILADDWFKSGPAHIKNLYIMTNFIKQIGDRAFAPLREIQKLWLTGNMFQTIKRSMLPNPALHLVSLDLTNNEISHVPEDMFTSMPALKEVILAENNIQHLPQTTWSTIWNQLTRLYLESNPLVCDAAVEWVLQVNRPYVLKARCASPQHRKDVELKTLIDDSIRDRENDFDSSSIYKQ